MPSLSDYTSTFAKAVKNRYTTVAIFIFVGVLLMGIGIPAIPALGIPKITTMWIGLALMLYGIYHYMPNASAILDKAREGTGWRCPYALQPGAALQPGVRYCRRPTIWGWRSVTSPPKCRGIGMTHDETECTPAQTRLNLDGTVFGILYLKSMLKILAVTFAALEFMGPPISNFPFRHILIPLVFLFLVYFQMPTGYKANEPYKACEAWYRMLVGFILALLIMIFLTPNPTATFTTVFWTQFAIAFGLSIGIMVAILALTTMLLTSIISFWRPGLVPPPPNPTFIYAISIVFVLFLVLPLFSAMAPAVSTMPGVAAFYLMLAFFTSMPVKRPAEKEEEEISIDRTGGVGRFAQSMSDTIGYFKEQWNPIGNVMFFFFALMGGIPVFAWATLGASMKLAYGVVWGLSIAMGLIGGREGRPFIGVIVIGLLLISFSFAFSSTIGTAVFGYYWGTIESTGEMFFGPIATQLNTASCDAYANYQCLTAGPIECSRIKLECQRTESEAVGNDKSIEVTEFIAAPKEITRSTVDDKFQNNTVYLLFQNAGDYEAENVRFSVGNKTEVGIVENVGVKRDAGIAEVVSCIGGDYVGNNVCEWPGKFRPGSRGGVNFVLDWKYLPVASSELLKYYGYTPNVTLYTEYDYHVESAYQVDVRSHAEMARLMQEGADIAGTMSKYTGGPIIASLWTPKYVESGQTTFVSAALTNDKEGTATNVTYCIYVPLDMGTPTKMSDARLNGDRCEPMEGAEVVQCHWSSIHSAQSYNTNTMKPDNFKDCSFQLNPDTKGAPQKQLALVGKAKFHYSIKTVRKDIPILG